MSIEIYIIQNLWIVLPFRYLQRNVKHRTATRVLVYFKKDEIQKFINAQTAIVSFVVIVIYSFMKYYIPVQDV